MVLGFRNRGGNHHSRGVNLNLKYVWLNYCLPYVPSVDSSRNLLYQNGRQSMRPQLLMHAKEIDLGHFNLFPVNHDLQRNGRDKSHDFLIFFQPNDWQPFWVLSRRVKGPLQKLD